jgi:hypothetical protein
VIAQRIPGVLVHRSRSQPPVRRQIDAEQRHPDQIDCYRDARLVAEKASAMREHQQDEGRLAEARDDQKSPGEPADQTRRSDVVSRTRLAIDRRAPVACALLSVVGSTRFSPQE